MLTFSRYATALCKLGGGLVVAFSSVALTAHIGPGEPVGWLGTTVPMALDTSLCLIALGTGLFSLARVLEWHIKKCHK